MNRSKLLVIAGYNAFFWLCFWLFCYWTFPYDRLAVFLSDKVAASGTGYTLEIGELAPHWITGVELTDVKIQKQGKADAPPPVQANGKGAPAQDDAIEVREAHARIGLLGLLLGGKELTFDALLKEGELDGRYEEDGTRKVIDLTLSSIDLGKLGLLESVVSLPMKGTLEGDVDLVLDQEVTKSSGTATLTLKKLVIGDGQAKLKVGSMGGLTIDPIDVGDVTIELDVKDGVGKVKKLAANGPDVELDGSGDVRFAEPLSRTRLDLNLRFKFTDAYKNKSSRTQAMFTLLEGAAVPQVRAAKTDDGSLAFRITGMLSLPRALPAGRSASRGTNSRAGAAPAPSPSIPDDEDEGE
jgi:type II secretion system protein N